MVCPEESFTIPDWTKEAGHWQLPPKQPGTSARDAFMLGGNGRVSARMGMRPNYRTIDRFMGPEYDSYGYYQTNYFRMSCVSVAIEYPHECVTEEQRLWRVAGTAIMCTRSRVRVQHEHDSRVQVRGVQITTVDFVLPDLTALVRLIAIKNDSLAEAHAICLALDAPPDIPWPKPGHCSVIEPHGDGRLLERVTEYARVSDRGLHNKQYSQTEIQRYRFCLRGLVGGSNRGFQELASDPFSLLPGEERAFVAYMAVSGDGTAAGAVEVEDAILEQVQTSGPLSILERTRRWWANWHEGHLTLTCPDSRVSDFFDAESVHQKQTEHHTGGFMVGDDYTQCFVRDCNGSHLWLLDTGHFEEVRRSMEFFFRMDAHTGQFANSYSLDTGESLLEPHPPYWFEDPTLPDKEYQEAPEGILKLHEEKSEAEWRRHGLITPGDVPSFRVLWYWWYHLRTGNLKWIEKRWSYLRALVRLQRLEQYGYLAGYSRDETYGIGPVDRLRRGNSADNSFIALAAVRAMSKMASRLRKTEDANEFSALAEKIQSAIEEKLWVEASGIYAMRITPEGELDSRPCSPGLLRPLWVGALEAENDHVASSVEFVLEHMMLEPGFIRIVLGSHYETCGHFPAYLLIGLCKLDHPGVEKAFDDLLRYINPSGTCAEYYSYGSPTPVPLMHRARNWESGVNADAVLYFLTGFESDAHARRITLKPRLPTTWEGFRVERMRIGESFVSLEAKRVDGEVLYQVDHQGPHSLAIEGHFALPRDWGTAALWVNQQRVETMVRVNRYGVTAAHSRLEIGPDQMVTIRLRHA